MDAWAHDEVVVTQVAVGSLYGLVAAARRANVALPSSVQSRPDMTPIRYSTAGSDSDSGLIRPGFVAEGIRAFPAPEALLTDAR